MIDMAFVISLMIQSDVYPTVKTNVHCARDCYPLAVYFLLQSLLIEVNANHIPLYLLSSSKHEFTGVNKF